MSRALAERLGVPHVELDALFWQSGWQETPKEEFRERVVATLADLDGWVVDGNYRSRLGTLVLEEAEMIVWLDLPLRTTLSRVLRRTLGRIRTRDPLWGSNTETWRNAFFRRDALWLFALKAHFRWRRRLPTLLAPFPHVRLRSKDDVERFLANVG